MAVCKIPKRAPKKMSAKKTSPKKTYLVKR